eukprot:TRINITY_DN1618_c0_g1_i10.p1 TRINITY_DN1618_c0_g1~~TRINITY_DN1618_c0_g1_i10.p1  ORF type:complete len:843 (-),score=332.45 TRINITY_DN1618_c0_g1_i10:727-3255(-)
MAAGSSGALPRASRPAVYAITAVAAAGCVAAHRWNQAVTTKRLADGIVRCSPGRRRRGNGDPAFSPGGAFGAPFAARGGATGSLDEDSGSDEDAGAGDVRPAGAPNGAGGGGAGLASSAVGASGAPAAAAPPGLRRKRSGARGATTGAGGGGVDRAFVEQLWKFLKVLVPGVRSREFGLLAIIASLLGARSYCDIWATDNGGRVVKAIVSRDRRAFFRRAIRDIFIMAWPMSAVNTGLRYFLARLKVAFRLRLSNHFHDKYLSGNTYYAVSNLDSRIQNVDQLLTTDIDRFCTALADIYSNLSKPALDVVLFSRRLSRSLGPRAAPMLIAYFVACSVALRSVQPPFGKLVAEEARLEGEYRLHHSRLITHGEEVAFYRGGAYEKAYITDALGRVAAHMRRVFRARARIGFADQFLIKYLATIVGYGLVSIPVFYPHMVSPHYRAAAAPRASPRAISAAASLLPANLVTPPEAACLSAEKTPADDAIRDGADSSASDIAGLYTRNSRLLLALAGAIGRLVLAGKSITALTGYCARVARLDEVLSDLAVSTVPRMSLESSMDLDHEARLATLMTPGGLVEGHGGGVRFAGVNVISPDRQVLLKDVNVEIPRGTHVIVAGPNGSGKSSLFRVLAGLWPLYGGTLYRPAGSRVFYVPQRPYLTLGTLRAQVVYPLTWTEAVAEKGATDELIMGFLSDARLLHVAGRKGGLDAVRDWADVLSGGEKQRLGFARMLFARPDYAVLDEASAAISLEAEGYLYERAQELGVTLISVSHRPSLFRFHTKILALDGSGGYVYRDLVAGDVPAMTFSAGEGSGASAVVSTAPDATESDREEGQEEVGARGSVG